MAMTCLVFLQITSSYCSLEKYGFVKWKYTGELWICEHQRCLKILYKSSCQQSIYVCIMSQYVKWYESSDSPRIEYYYHIYKCKEFQQINLSFRYFYSTLPDVMPDVIKIRNIYIKVITIHVQCFINNTMRCHTNRQTNKLSMQKDWLLIKLCWFESKFPMKIQLTKLCLNLPCVILH